MDLEADSNSVKDDYQALISELLVYKHLFQ